MHDLNPAVATDPFPDWPFGVHGSTDRHVICRGEKVRVPLDVAECPNCHFILEAEPGIIPIDENGTRWIDTISMRCRSGEGKGPCRTHPEWASVQERVRDWMRETYQVPPRDHTVSEPMKRLFFEDSTE